MFYHYFSQKSLNHCLIFLRSFFKLFKFQTNLHQSFLPFSVDYRPEILASNNLIFSLLLCSFLLSNLKLSLLNFSLQLSQICLIVSDHLLVLCIFFNYFFYLVACFVYQRTQLILFHLLDRKFIIFFGIFLQFLFAEFKPLSELLLVRSQHQVS